MRWNGGENNRIGHRAEHRVSIAKLHSVDVLEMGAADHYTVLTGRRPRCRGERCYHWRQGRERKLIGTRSG
jgi:hypothetical protein